MTIRLPQYSGKDYLVLAFVIMPVSVIVNSFIFGTRYFAESQVFFLATLLTALVFTVDFVLCGAIAISFKNRMIQEEDTTKRLFVMMLSFVGLSGLFLSVVFHGYELIPQFSYSYNEHGFVWAYLIMAIINVFLTLLMEGIFRYNNWRDSLKETETIREAFAHSQLLGLKSQVNPHFLFNSLNTLSSLIYEDEKAAERFLNEMSKVYRYMLRGDDEQLVPLSTELRFIGSYMHLLEKRFGQSLQVKLQIAGQHEALLLPPLSLQVLIENAFTQNSMSKTDPLVIVIRSTDTDLVVTNTRQPKIISSEIDVESGLDNLVVKYRLLSDRPVAIQDGEDKRTVRLPLIQPKGGRV